MKKLLYVLPLLLLGNAYAGWEGKLDLTPNVSPIVIREVHDGQWLAGVSKNNILHLDYSGDTNSVWNGQRFHLGAFEAWNTEHGNASTGLVGGVDIPLPLSEALGYISSALQLQESFKPAEYLSSMISFDIIGGYRPLHDASVNGNWVYGAGASLNIAFGVKELQKGL